MSEYSEALKEILHSNGSSGGDKEKRIMEEIKQLKLEQSIKKKFNQITNIWVSKNLDEFIKLTKKLSKEDFNVLIKETSSYNFWKWSYYLSIIIMIISVFYNGNAGLLVFVFLMISFYLKWKKRKALMKKLMPLILKDRV